MDRCYLPSGSSNDIKCRIHTYQVFKGLFQEIQKQAEKVVALLEKDSDDSEDDLLLSTELFERKIVQYNTSKRRRQRNE